MGTTGSPGASLAFPATGLPKAVVTPDGSKGKETSSLAVKWEECLSDSNERYYHEAATGRVQWELPEDGWVRLLADDGSSYYWDPVADITQWDPPSTSAAVAR